MLPDNETTPDPRRWKALALLSTALFMVLLDASILLVALPTIGARILSGARDLAGLAQVEWHNGPALAPAPVSVS